MTTDPADRSFRTRLAHSQRLRTAAKSGMRQLRLASLEHSPKVGPGMSE
jgi:hypothetical protein